jgi:RND family efflux transporter MFP subunit
MAVDDRLSDLLVEWEQGRRSGQEPSIEDLCRDTPDLLPFVRESIASLRATEWMFEPPPSESSSSSSAAANAGRAALHDTELPASHLTAQEFAASIFQSGLLSRDEIEELKQRLGDSALPGEAREIASKLVSEGKLTRYQAAVLLKASKDPLLIDNYVILDTLDTGGMGLVFKALHRSMNRVVALKLLPAAMMSARDTVKRFQREVQAAAALKHPNIVAAYDADESEEIAYLVLEFVDGTNLFRLVKEQGPRPLAEGVDFVRQAATGLSYLHSRGIIHRDVKPANLLLAKDGTVKLLDMGLVRFASSEDLSCSEMDQELTQAGIVIGTVAYMSPEQALDTRSADQRSDIYSLGCTLFYLLTGRSLYHEETGMKTLLAHREQPVPSLREFCEEAPVSLDAVFRTMVAKRPADRLQSMDEVIAALDACVPPPAPPAGRAVRPVPIAPPLRTGTNRGRVWQSRRFRIGALITALAAATIGSIYLAVIVIRIKTSQGSTELTVTDPNAKIEIETHTAGPAVSQLQPPAEANRPGGIDRDRKMVGFYVNPPATKPRPPVPVVTATVRKGDFEVYMYMQGRVRASQTVMVKSRVDGEITNVNFTEGQFVHAGDLLFEVDDRPYKAQLEQAQAQLKQDSASLTQAQQDLARDKQLASTNSITEEALRAATAAVARNEAVVAKDKARMEEAKLQVDYCHITAPIAGRIGLRLVDKGNLVQAATGANLVNIAQFQPVDVRFHIPQDEIERVQQKLNSTKQVAVEIWSSNLGSKIATAHVVGVDNTVNPAGENIAAIARTANADNHLFPGEYVRVRLLAYTLHDAVIVPTAAIHDGEGETFAFVIKSDQTVEKRKVIVRRSENGQTVVTNGLSPGDIVVVEKNDNLRNGSPVIVASKAEGHDTPVNTTASVDRQVADWVLANRGTVHLKEFRGHGAFQYVDALPPTDFHIVTINLNDYITDDAPSAAPADDMGARRFGSRGFGGGRMRFRPNATGSGERTGRTRHRIDFTDADLDRLASLTELRSLTFASSAVTDDVLSRLKGLTNLTYLGLEGAGITDAGLASLSGMSDLTNLDLDATAIGDAGLKEIARLKSLNDLKRIPEAQRSGRGPRTEPSLRLGQTRTTVNGIDELQRALPHCMVSASHLNGFSPAPPAPGSSDRDWAQWMLYQVQGSRHVFTDLDPETPISSYEELPPVDFHIVRINFDSELGISETMLRRMAGLSQLRRIYFKGLSAPAFTGLGEIKQLESLWIEQTDVADDALQVLGNLTRLKLLQLGDKYLADSDLAHLAPLHDLTALRLDGHSKGLHGSGFAALTHLDHLTSLAVPDSGIEDEMMASIGKLGTLEDLDLSRTWITSKGLASLASLSRLKKLQLNGCRRLDASSLEPLAKLPHLELLALANWRIDETIVESLKKLTSLRQLYIQPNGGLSPGAFQALFPALQASLPKCSINGSLGVFDFEPGQQGGIHSLWNPASSGGAKSFRAREPRHRSQSGGAENAKQTLTTTAKTANGKAGGKAQAGSEAEVEVSGPKKLHKVSPEPAMLDRMNKETSPDRAIAVWVQAFGGDFGTDLKVNPFVRVAATIPAGDFHIVSIFLYDLPSDCDREILHRAEQRVPIPEAVLSRLAQLTHLKVLHLDCRECSDATLKTLSKLPSLRALQLRHTSITDAGLASLGSLKQLRWLDLRHTATTDKGLRELAKMKLFSNVPLPSGPLPWARPSRPELLIDETPTTDAGIVEFQKAVPNCLISAAHLMDSELSRGFGGELSVAPFPPAPGSTDREWADWLFLCLHDCRILTDADPETWFNNRESLPPIDFHITQIEFGRGSLQPNQSSSLEHLTPLILRHLSDLPQLERLVLISPQENVLPAIATLKRLKSLWLLRASNLGDDALKTVGTMTKLERFGIESDRITDASLKNLANLANLTALGLSDERNVHGSGLKELTAATKLRVLSLANSGIDDAGLAEVARFHALEQLDLSGTWISPKGLASLVGLANLKQLDLHSCRRIDDSVLRDVVKLKQLRFLNLDNTRVTGGLISELNGNLPGCSIRWNTPPMIQQRDPKTN